MNLALLWNTTETVQQYSKQSIGSFTGEINQFVQSQQFALEAPICVCVVRVCLYSKGGGPCEAVVACLNWKFDASGCVKQTVPVRRRQVPAFANDEAAQLIILEPPAHLRPSDQRRNHAALFVVVIFSFFPPGLQYRRLRRVAAQFQCLPAGFGGRLPEEQPGETVRPCVCVQVGDESLSNHTHHHHHHHINVIKATLWALQRFLHST